MGRSTRPTRSSERASTTSSRVSKATPHTEEILSPFADGNEGQISKDQDAALVTFSIPGDDDHDEQRVDATLAATAAAQKANPDLRIEQFGDASADKALERLARRRLQARGVPLASRSRC